MITLVVFFSLFIYFLPKGEILCLQTRKCRGDNVDRTLGCFVEGLTFGPLKLVLAMELRVRDLGIGGGGIAMCFHPRVHPLIHYRGSLAINSVQWIRFKGLEGCHLGIWNVYASDMACERCTMWNFLGAKIKRSTARKEPKYNHLGRTRQTKGKGRMYHVELKFSIPPNGL